uniref:Uncharacterized protein n=1 Tax=Ditylenchus dipsaci TaxID=166011 RepID=A0A915DY08_9BILA
MKEDFGQGRKKEGFRFESQRKTWFRIKKDRSGVKPDDIASATTPSHPNQSSDGTKDAKTKGSGEKKLKKKKTKLSKGKKRREPRMLKRARLRMARKRRPKRLRRTSLAATMQTRGSDSPPLIKARDEQTKQCKKVVNKGNETARVRVTDDESFYSFDIDHLRRFDKSSTSDDYFSPYTNNSFERHVLGGRMIEPAPTEMIKVEEIVEPKYCCGCCSNSKSFLDTKQPIVVTIDEPKFSSLVYSKKPPSSGDFEPTTANLTYAKNAGDCDIETLTPIREPLSDDSEFMPQPSNDSGITNCNAASLTGEPSVTGSNKESSTYNYLTSFLQFVKDTAAAVAPI